MFKYTPTESDNKEILDMLDEYLNTFQEMSVEKALDHYQTPVTLHLPQQDLITLYNAEDVESFLKSQFSMMASDNYGSSQWGSIHLHRLHETNALVSTVVRRFDVDGNLIVESGSTYSLVKVDQQWKIVMLIPHDIANVIMK